MSFDVTFCADQCVNHHCHRNKLHTAKAPEYKLLSFAHLSKNCVEYEAPDDPRILKRPLKELMYKLLPILEVPREQKDLKVDYKHIYIQFIERLPELKSIPVTESDKQGFEKVLEATNLRKSILPWYKKAD
jgi:hypothetical protein